jgi:hypothetical protein
VAEQILGGARAIDANAAAIVNAVGGTRQIRRSA